MADAIVTSMRLGSDQPKLKLHGWKPSKAVSIAFLGGGGNETSEFIEKTRFGLVDFSYPTGTAVLTFLVANKSDGTYRLLDGFSIDTAVGNTKGTSALAGYAYFKVVQDVAAAMVVEAGMI